MSSLQKFHRRTNGGTPPPLVWTQPTNLSDATAPTYGGDGSGDNTIGYWLGNVGSYKLRVAPKSTESYITWGSYGTVRGTTFMNNGWANTQKLYYFGTTGHPAAGSCTSLTTGGYTTWYLPAINEMLVLYSSKTKTPFATANDFYAGAHWTSTENNNNLAYFVNMSNRSSGNYYSKTNIIRVRAVRRSTI